jgi:anti-anti-sigma factor
MNGPTNGQDRPHLVPRDPSLDDQDDQDDQAPDDDPAASLDVRLVVADDAVQVDVSGEIDLANAGTFARYLLRAGRTATERGCTVVVNLRDVPYLDSSGLNAFVRARKAYPAVAWELRELRPIVLKLFRLTGLDQMFATSPLSR